MRILYSFLMFCFLLSAANAQETKWLLTFGGTESDQGYDCAACPDGSSVFCGSFSDTVQWGDVQLMSKGKIDMFLMKVNPQGQVLWAVSACGDTTSTIGRGVAVDQNNNVYVCGSFVKFIKIGTDSLTSQTLKQGAFIAKFDKDGNYLWAKAFSGTQNDYVEKVSVSDTNLYASVKFSDTIYVDNNMVVSDYPGIKASSSCSLIAGMNTDGNLHWIAKINAKSSFTRGLSAGVSSGDVYCISEASIDAASPWISIAGNDEYFAAMGNPIGSTDDYVYKLNKNNGQVKWINKIGSTSNDMAYPIVLDQNENVYCGPLLHGETTFNSQDGNFQTLPQKGSGFDLGICKYDSTGNLKWADIQGGTSIEGLYDMAVNSQGEVYGAGYFLDPYTVMNEDTFLCENDGNGALLIKYSASGSYLNGLSAHTTYMSGTTVSSNLYIWGMDYTTAGNLCMIGYFIGDGTFFYGDTISSNGPAKDVLMALVQPEANTGIKQNKAEEGQVKVWPQPASTNLSLRTEAAGMQITGVEVLTLTGTCIERITGPVETINTSRLATGYYVFRINTNQGVVRKKVIVVH